jgi:general secretion pathway protein L
MILWISQQAPSACAALLTAWWEELDGMWQEIRPLLPVKPRPYLDLVIRKGTPAPAPSVKNGPPSFLQASRKRPVRICLEPGLFLKRRLYLPKTALKDARRILLLELERTTPFSAADVFQGWTCEFLHNSKAVVDHVIVRRDLLQPWLDYLSALQVPFASEVGIGTDRPSTVDLLGELIRQNPHMRRLRRLRLLTFATMLATAMACLMAAHWRQSVALDQLTNELAAIKPKAVQVRTKLARLEIMFEQAAALRDYRRSFHSPLDLWRELTSLLPDSAWLTELRIERGEVTISGLAPSSAVLLEAMENSAVFEKAAFVSPVMKPPGESLERFVVRASLSNARPPPRLSILAKTP